MDWMLTHQLSSKNLSVGEKLALMDSVREELKKYNEQKNLKELIILMKAEELVLFKVTEAIPMKRNPIHLLHTQGNSSQKKQV